MRINTSGLVFYQKKQIIKHFHSKYLEFKKLLTSFLNFYTLKKFSIAT